MGLVRREQGSLRWPVVRDALWLRSPRAPRTGRRGGKLWLLVLPLSVAIAAEGLLAIPGPAARDFFEFLGSDAGEDLLAGSWGWFAIIAALIVFNTVLGEEFLFRGYLLPRMNGRFGRRDWLANGVLFAGYHLHMPWAIPTTLLDTFILSYKALPQCAHQHRRTARRASSCWGSCSRWCSKAETCARPRSTGVAVEQCFERAASSAAVPCTTSCRRTSAGEVCTGPSRVRGATARATLGAASVKKRASPSTPPGWSRWTRSVAARACRDFRNRMKAAADYG